MKTLDKNLVFWFFIGALLFFPFLGGVHLFDWDEINFAELAREMVVSGDWLRMQMNFENFTEKPPLFFWLQALSMKLFGIGEYAARFPNALLGALALPYLYFLGKKLVDRSFGFFWSLSWFGSILPFLYYKSGIIDPVFNFFIFNGLLFYILAIEKEKGRGIIHLSQNPTVYLILSGASIGLAILTKGPVAYLLVFITAVVSQMVFKNQEWKSFLKKGLWVSISALLVFLTWFLVEFSINGPDFLVEFTIRQWELLTRADAGHGGFPGYHFVVLLLGCFPTSLFAIRGLYLQHLDKSSSHEVWRRYMVVLLLVVLVLFSLVGTKIIHYSSMAYYPISFLSALVLWKLKNKEIELPKWIIASVAVIGFLIVLISTVLPLAGINIAEVRPLFQKDLFALGNLQAKVHWSFWNLIPAIMLLFIISFFASQYQRKAMLSVNVLFFGIAIWTFTALIHFVGRVEAISQRASVEFFESYQNKEVYVSTYGYKSYVPYFYARVQPYSHPRAQEKEWLYHGNIDRDLIIATKVNKVDKLHQDIGDAELIYAKNGFYFFRRPAVVEAK